MGDQTPRPYKLIDSSSQKYKKRLISVTAKQQRDRGSLSNHSRVIGSSYHLSTRLSSSRHRQALIKKKKLYRSEVNLSRISKKRLPIVHKQFEVLDKMSAISFDFVNQAIMQLSAPKEEKKSIKMIELKNGKPYGAIFRAKTKQYYFCRVDKINFPLMLSLSNRNVACEIFISFTVPKPNEKNYSMRTRKKMLKIDFPISPAELRASKNKTERLSFLSLKDKSRLIKYVKQQRALAGDAPEEPEEPEFELKTLEEAGDMINQRFKPLDKMKVLGRLKTHPNEPSDLDQEQGTNVGSRQPTRPNEEDSDSESSLRGEKSSQKGPSSEVPEKLSKEDQQIFRDLFKIKHIYLTIKSYANFRTSIRLQFSRDKMFGVEQIKKGKKIMEGNINSVPKRTLDKIDYNNFYKFIKEIKVPRRIRREMQLASSENNKIHRRNLAIAQNYNDYKSRKKELFKSIHDKKLENAKKVKDEIERRFVEGILKKRRAKEAQLRRHKRMVSVVLKRSLREVSVRVWVVQFALSKIMEEVGEFLEVSVSLEPESLLFWLFFLFF